MKYRIYINLGAIDDTPQKYFKRTIAKLTKFYENGNQLTPGDLLFIDLDDVEELEKSNIIDQVEKELGLWLGNDFKYESKALYPTNQNNPKYDMNIGLYFNQDRSNSGPKG